MTGRAQGSYRACRVRDPIARGAVHNAARGRVPVLIFAGTSPAHRKAKRGAAANEFIHWLQDSFDQQGLVRGYMRYQHEVRVGANVKQIVHSRVAVRAQRPERPRLPHHVPGGVRTRDSGRSRSTSRMDADPARLGCRPGLRMISRSYSLARGVR